MVWVSDLGPMRGLCLGLVMALPVSASSLNLLCITPITFRYYEQNFTVTVHSVFTKYANAIARLTVLSWDDV